MSPGRRRWPLVALIVTLAIGVVMHRLLVNHRLEQTAALFIGLPTVLALALLLTARPKSATGMIMLVITLFLLVSAMFLGEGFICILMASPIAYAIGLCIGVVIDWMIEKRKRTTALMIIPFAAMSLEGVTDRLSFQRAETITVDQIVAAPTASVEQALTRAPHFNHTLPLFLRLGFPMPVNASGSGLDPGSERRIHFAGGEGRPGDLLAKVTAHDSHGVKLAIVSDTSHIAHWLAWKDAEVTWVPLDNQRTRVRWTLTYRRLLDPAWYFGPWERLAVRQAAGYLIDTLATP